MIKLLIPSFACVHWNYYLIALLLMCNRIFIDLCDCLYAGKHCYWWYYLLVCRGRFINHSNCLCAIYRLLMLYFAHVHVHI